MAFTEQGEMTTRHPVREAGIEQRLSSLISSPRARATLRTATWSDFSGIVTPETSSPIPQRSMYPA